MKESKEDINEMIENREEERIDNYTKYEQNRAEKKKSFESLDKKAKEISVEASQGEMKQEQDMEQDNRGNECET